MADGHIDYYSAPNYTATVPAKYPSLEIAGNLNSEQFKAELLAHQQGKIDYLTFIHMCASCGIDKWVVMMDEMTCTYYDKVGNETLVEAIPQ